MTRFRKSSSTGQKRPATNSRRVVKGLKRKRRRHLPNLSKSAINQPPSQLTSPKSLPNPSRHPASRPLKSPRRSAKRGCGFWGGFAFPRSAHDNHAEQERHEQKGPVRHHRRRLDSLLAARARWRRIKVSVEGIRPRLWVGSAGGIASSTALRIWRRNLPRKALFRSSLLE